MSKKYFFLFCYFFLCISSIYILASQTVIHGTVQGNSMYPTIKDGEEYVAVKQQPQIGDVIVYKTTINNKSYIVIHRLIAENITQGDNNTCIDSFQIEQLLGVVIWPNITNKSMRI